MVLVLAREQILEVLSYPDVIDVVERAHAAHAEQVAVQPERPVVHIPGSDALMVPMIAATGPDAAGVKLLMDLPSNRDVGRPPQQSTVVLVDPQTGECTAFLDGGAITLFRTAAASAVATRHLARPGTVTLGLIGAGAQAHAHLQAIRCVREVERVLVWNRTAESAARFAAATTAATGLTVKVMASP
ncbi:MAG: hypothetical protein J0H43_13985 [Actinobacteria bacterium]|nr:hypothetical protein [Actinomycetota bacterium]